MNPLFFSLLPLSLSLPKTFSSLPFFSRLGPFLFMFFFRTPPPGTHYSWTQHKGAARGRSVAGGNTSPEVEVIFLRGMMHCTGGEWGTDGTWGTVGTSVPRLGGGGERSRERGRVSENRRAPTWPISLTFLKPPKMALAMNEGNKEIILLPQNRVRPRGIVSWVFRGFQ